MDPREAQRLIDEGKWASESGDFTSALACFQKLEKAFPEGGDWSNEVADIYRELKDLDGELGALARAAERYGRCGAHLKAIVMCKRMIDIDPDSDNVRRRLGDLHPSIRALGLEQPQKPKKVERPNLEVGEPLDSISVADALDAPEQEDGVRNIPIFSQDDISTAFADVMMQSGPAKPAQPPDPAGPTSEMAFPLTPLFAALDQEGFERLVDKLNIIFLQPNEVLFRQGRPGNSFFVITDGAVEVVHEEDGQVLAQLDEGEFFGEIALITNQPRTASVRAIKPTELIEIDRAAMGHLIFEDPTTMPTLLWFLRDRLVDTLMRTNPLFAKFTMEKRRAVADRFQFIETREDLTLIEQGSRSRGLIIVLSGHAEVWRSFDEREIEIGALKTGDICGEISLLTNEPAIASVKTRGHFIGLELPTESFRLLVAEHPYMLDLIKAIADERRQKFIAALEEAMTYSQGSLPLL